MYHIRPVQGIYDISEAPYWVSILRKKVLILFFSYIASSRDARRERGDQVPWRSDQDSRKSLEVPIFRGQKSDPNSAISRRPKSAFYVVFTVQRGPHIFENSDDSIFENWGHFFDPRKVSGFFFFACPRLSFGSACLLALLVFCLCLCLGLSLDFACLLALQVSWLCLSLRFACLLALLVSWLCFFPGPACQ